jgi:preprotein translocase subunit SecA
MRNLERAVLLQIIDNRWREHLYDMDYLREGIHLRGFAQRDPLVEYKNEGFALFRDLMNSIWEDFAKYIFHIEVEIAPAEAQIAFTPSASRTSSTRGLNYTGGGPEQPSALYGAAEEAGVPAAVAAAEGEDLAALPEVETRHLDERDKIGRNDPCWCGSGKKFKKCHGA